MVFLLGIFGPNLGLKKGESGVKLKEYCRLSVHALSLTHFHFLLFTPVFYNSYAFTLLIYRIRAGKRPTHFNSAALNLQCLCQSI